MKRWISPLVQLPVVFLVTLFFSGCLKDKITKTYSILVPIYEDRPTVLASMKMSDPEPLKATGKIFVSGRYIYLNEINRGVHVIDNADPTNPTQVGFIPIPGNLDIAVKDHVLLADFYSDLVSIDITDPLHAKLINLVPGVFPERYYGPNGYLNSPDKIIVDWIRKDTTVAGGPVIVTPGGCPNCGVFLTADAAYSNSTPVPGLSGSMAAFSVVNDYLYAVDRHSLKVISVANPATPVVGSIVYAGWDIETIFPFGSKLFLGSMGGLFIYDISDPANPVSQGNFVHARACDPVIVDGHYAYVTLRAGTICGPSDDELQIVDVSNLAVPTLFKRYSMNNPHGLAKDGSLLFICDGSAGLKIYNAADPGQLQLIKRIGDINTYDVIAYNHIALVVGTDGLYQYDYSNSGDIRLLSKISINHN